ncbi:MAG: TonB family protein [Pseudomonadota bacterium]
MLALFSPSRLLQAVRRTGMLGAIIGLHLGFLVVFQSGLLQKTKVLLSEKEVFVSLITPEPPARAVVPVPAVLPKTVPLVKPAVKPVSAPPVAAPVPAPATAPAPTPILAPSEQAISTPPPATVAAPATPAIAAAAVAPVAAAPAAPAVPATPPTVSSGIEYIQQPQPEFPAMSKRMREEGKVILRVLINDKGRAERVEIHKSSGSARLDEAGRQAVLRSVFKPYLENGKAIAAFTLLPINFQLDN